MRGGHDTKSYGEVRRILVGVDGSEGAAAALRWAINMARQTGAEIVAAHAFDVPAVTPEATVLGPVYSVRTDDPDWWDRLREDDGRAFEQEWCAPMAEAGVPHQTVQETGGAAQVIEAVAERTGADLIVVGRRGLNTLAELVMGSVSHALVHHADRPVTVVATPPGR